MAIDFLNKVEYYGDIMAQLKKKSEHYVNNKEFLAAMVEYKKSVNRAKRNKDNKAATSLHSALSLRSGCRTSTCRRESRRKDRARC